MKTKYQGFAGIVFFVLSFAGIIIYGIFLAGTIQGSIKITRPVLPGSKIKVPDKSTMAYIEYLTPHLAELSRLKDSQGFVDLKLFDYTKVFLKKTSAIGPINKSVNPGISAADSASPKVKTKKQSPSAAFSYSLTLAFVADDNRFCVVDGKIYKENMYMGDGARILKIENDRVLILKKNKKQWINALL